MPECQALGCKNKRGETKQKSFFMIPDAKRFPEKRELAQKWLHNIGTGHTVDKFSFGKHKVVCEDHFEEWCFNIDFARRAAILGEKVVRKTLNPGAFPSLFHHRQPKVDAAREGRVRKREHKKLSFSLVWSIRSLFVSLAALNMPTGDVTVLQKLVLAGVIKPRAGYVTQDVCDLLKFRKKPRKNSVILQHPTQLQDEFLDKTSGKENQNENDIWNTSMSLELHQKTWKNQTSTSSQTKDTAMQTDSNPVVCDICNNPVGDLDVIRFMHSYSKQLKPTEEESNSIQIVSSIPDMPSNSFIPNTDTTLESVISADDECLDCCESEDDVSESIDEDYIPSSDSESYSSDEERVSLTEKMVFEKKYVVFESCLDKLMYRIPCEECGSAVEEIHKSYIGSMLRVKLFCISGHLVFSWDSQPIVGEKMPAGNILMSAATLYTGQTYTHLSEFAEHLNMQFFSHSTYYNVQKNLLLPVIDQHWQNEKVKVLNEIKSRNHGIQLAGDGRCDSPGYSAKYCNYTFMDVESDKIVDFELVQVNQAASSVAMEKKGFENCLDRILKNVNITDISTDRHTGIRKLMREKYCPRGISHQFDPYHMVNWVRKKLTEKTKQSKSAELEPWVKSVLNHLWWSAAASAGDPDKLLEQWESVLKHVCNQHKWKCGNRMSGCEHAALSSEQQRRKKWLKADSLAYKALEEIVMHRGLQKDMTHLVKFIHTGKLEVYHSLLNKYSPKRQQFDFPCMMGRSQLAILDHNNNVGRKQDTIKRTSTKSGVEGEKKFSTYWSKATKQWVARPRLEGKRHDYIQSMMLDVVESKSSCEELHASYNDAIPDPVTLYLASKNPRPSKTALVEKHTSRFTKPSSE